MASEFKYAGNDFVPTLRHDTYPEINPLNVDLHGKTVVITGASKGIGRAIALSFAKSGVSGLVILARSDLASLENEILAVAEEASRSQPKVLRLAFDITDRTQVESAARQVESTFGGVDILVNNAGYLDSFDAFADTDPDDWWRTYEVNVKGVYLMARAFLPLVLKSNDKTIIACASIGAVSTQPGMSAYQSSKTAVVRLNDLLMVDYGEQGLLAYAIHPGGVWTDMAEKMPKHTHPLFVDTAELAGDFLVWLTRKRREWLAERYINVTWDVSELLMRKDEIVQNDLLKLRMRV
ncbi:hypothetical protein BDW62DRAFT_205885 [Aspergillus aurantiobrunneus]